MNIFEEWEQPIKIAEMLINASHECEANSIQKAFGCPDKYDGSYGFDDFIGFRKVEDENEPNRKMEKQGDKEKAPGRKY